MTDDAPENPTAAEQAFAPAGDVPPSDAAEQAAAAAEEAGVAAVDPPVRPREVIRGIHPELVCSCEECEPSYTELQWFSVDEQRKIKGTAMLFCAHTGRKYFSPVPELQAFLTANPRGRGK